MNGSQNKLTYLRLLGLRGLNRLLLRMMRKQTQEVLCKKLFGPLLVADPSRVSDEALTILIVSKRLPGAKTAWRTLHESVAGLGGFRKR